MSNNLLPVGIPLNQDYYQMALNDRDVMDIIIQIKKNYQSLSYLTSMLGDPIRHNKYCPELPFTDVSEIPTAQCTSNATLSQQNIIATIPIANQTNTFAVGYSVYDGTTQTSGKIISSSNTQLVVSFESAVLPTQTAFTSSDFASGNFVLMKTSARVDPMDPRSIQSRYFGVNLRKFAIQERTASVKIYRQDMHETSRIKRQGPNGVQYMAYYQVERMIDNFWSGFEFDCTYSNQVIGDDTGKGNVMGGVIHQIKNNDGIYHQLNGIPTEQDLKTMLDRYRIASGASGKIIMLPGAGWVGAMQTAITNNWLKYTGKESTFKGKDGGDVKGISVNNYAYLDIEVSFINKFNTFNKTSWQPAQSILGDNKAMYSCLMFDTAPVNTAFGTMPFLSRHYYGSNEGSVDGTFRVINGWIDENGNVPENPLSDVPAVTYIIESNSTILLANPTVAGFCELSA